MKRLCCSIILMGLSFCLASPEAAAAMPAVELLPAPEALPASRFLLKTLLLLTFFIHIVLVSILVGYCLITAVTAWRGGEEAGAGVAAKGWFLPSVLALAVNFGVAPYLFAQVLYGSFLYPGIVLMAVWWVSVAMFGMMAYYGLYIAVDKAPGGPPRGLVLTLSAISLLVVAFLLCTMNTLMLRPQAWTAWYANPGGTLLNTNDPSFPPRFLHFLVGFLAVGGLTRAFLADRGYRGGAVSGEERLAAVGSGLDWFIMASLAQLAVGAWFLFALPAPARALFLGGSPAAAFALGLALAGLAIALALARQRRVRLACAAALGVIFVMVVIRDMAREAMLLPYAEAIGKSVRPLALPEGQGVAVAVFLLCAALAAGVIVYIARAVNGAFRPPVPLTGTEE